jgi:RNA polymerase sigma-70 factor (ECF subfamily)
MAEHSPVGAEELRLHLLVLRCQAGDERAFTQLFEWFGGRTLGYLRGLLGEASDDVQQEVWLTVYRSISGLSNPRAFRTWLFRTTRHRAIDFLRKQKRERGLIVDAGPEVAAASETAGEGSIPAIDESVAAAAVAELPSAQREVLLLRYQDELSYAEIALVVGCPIGTVRTRLHHAKRRLHELLEGGHS